MLRLSQADGTVVNSQRAGFVLQNLTLNQRIMEGGGGEEVYFVILKTERYSLLLNGKEVWSYGEAPNPDLGLSKVCQIYLLRESTRTQGYGCRKGSGGMVSLECSFIIYS
jgi:hypothetical protein